MRGGKTLLLLACGVMDLSWYYAWAIFLTSSIFQQLFPFPEAVGAFALAAVLTHFFFGRGWRIISIAALQALFFIPLLLRVVGIFHSWSPSFAEQTWLTDSFFSAAAARDWCIFMLILLWIFPFWGGGIRLARRPMDYLTICSRFDKGLLAFLVLLLVKFIFLERVGIKGNIPVFEYLFFSFFLFSLLAIGLTRNRVSTGDREFLPGYRGIGVIAGFTVVLLLLSAGLTFFCLPYLTWAATKSYILLKEGARPLGSLLLAVFRFIFGSTDDWETKMPEKQAAKIPKLDSSTQYNWWVEFFGKFLVWIVWILLALVLLAIIGVTLYFFVQWLLSKTAVDPDRQAPLRPLPPWAERIRAFFHSFWRKIVQACRGFSRARHIFAALQKWGRNSGLPRLPSETPAEYGLRLKSRFPLLTGEIALIIEAFHREVYGGIILNDNNLAMIYAAWSRLRHPRHWPRRLKTWFSRPQEEADQSAKRYLVPNSNS